MTTASSKSESGPESEPESEPGLDARRTGVLTADAEIGPNLDLDWTAPRVHRALFDPRTNPDLALGKLLTRAIVDVLDSDASDQPAPLTVLDGLGVTALDGRFAELCVDAVSGAADDAALWNLLRTACQLGTGQTSLDLRSAREDIDRGVVPIFAASDVTPTIVIHLDGAFLDRTLAQRRDVIDLCLALAEGCRVHLVVSGLVGRVLWEQHRDQLPTSVTEQFDPRTHTTPAPGEPPALTERVTAARDRLDSEGTATTVLRALRTENSEMLSYDALSRELGLSQANRRQVASTLDRELALAERIDIPGGRGLSLRPAGRAYLDAIDEEIGRQHRLPTADADGVSSPPNPSEYNRVTPHAREGPPAEERPDHPPGDRPAEEGTAVASTQDRPRGHVQPVYLDRSSYEGARLAADSREIALVDAPTEELKRRDGEQDFRQMGWSYDPEVGELVVAARYVNLMQYWTCIARALASRWTFDRLLTEEVLEEIFSEYGRRVLRDARNIGGLSAERYEDPEAFIEYYREEEATLCELTRKWHHGEYEDADRMRREITTLAKGLSGSITQLLDLADVDLVREVRLPEFSRNWSDPQRRDTFVKTLAHGCSIESRYGHFVVHRQLYEHRESHRAAAMDPEVDARDPFGELIGSIVIIGPGVDRLENELRSALDSPGDLHDDAPELAVQIPIRTSGSRDRSVIARTVRRMCKRKQLEATREAISLFDGFLETSYDVVRAMHAGLASEETAREIRVDEVRRALAHLDPARLFPNSDVKPTMQKAVSVLLGAEQPLSGAAIAERAGISTESFRQNRRGFVLVDLLRETAEGWRLALSFADERYGEGDVLPWLFVDEQDMDSDAVEDPYFPSLDRRRPSDVVWELADSLADDPDRFGDPADVLYWGFNPPDPSDSETPSLLEHRRAARDAFCEEWPWLGGVFGLIDAACEVIWPDRSPNTGPVMMGPPIAQRPVSAASTEGVP